MDTDPAPSATRKREGEDVELENSPKRARIDLQESATDAPTITPTETIAATLSEHDTILPPSHALLGIPSPEMKGEENLRILESDVGISEYISRDIPQIQGIIKQR
jgi:tRNA pseudouridine13 synthase